MSDCSSRSVEHEGCFYKYNLDSIHKFIGYILLLYFRELIICYTINLTHFVFAQKWSRTFYRFVIL